MKKKRKLLLTIILLLCTNSFLVMAEEPITEQEKEELTYQFIGWAAANQNVSIQAENIETVKGLLWQDIEDMNLIDKIFQTTAQLKQSIRLTIETFKNGVFNIDVDKNVMFNQIFNHWKQIYGIGPEDQKPIQRVENPDGINGIRLSTRALTAQYNLPDQATIKLFEFHPNSQGMAVTNLADRAGFSKSKGTSDFIVQNNNGVTQYYIHFNGLIQAWKGTNNGNENITISIDAGNETGNYSNAIWKFAPNNPTGYYNLLDILEGRNENAIWWHFGLIDNQGQTININSNGSQTNKGNPTLTIEPGYSWIAVTQCSKWFTGKNYLTITATHNSNTGVTSRKQNWLSNYTGELNINENWETPGETPIIRVTPVTNETNMGNPYIAAYTPLPKIKIGQEEQTIETINIKTTANAQGNWKTPQIAYNNNYYQTITTPGGAQDAYWEDYKDSLNEQLTGLGTEITGYQQQIIDKYTELELNIQEVNQQENAYYSWNQENLNTEEQNKIDTMLNNEATLHEMTEQQQNTVNNWFQNQGIGINNPFKNFSSSKFLTSANWVKVQLTRMMNTKIGILVDIALILGILALVIGRL